MNIEENIHTTPTPRPLGFWLRVVDRLIEREFDAAFATEGTTRRDWRILNVLAGDIDAPELLERLQHKKLRGLVERGWVTESEGAWTLTDEGRAAKERLGDVVIGIRTKVAGSVPDEDFATTLRTLESIARELGWDGAAPERGFGHGRGRRGFGRRGFGPGFRPGRPEFGPGLRDRGLAPAEHGVPGHCGHPGHGRGRGQGGEHRTQRAYERGFDAGFTRGRGAQSA